MIWRLSLPVDLSGIATPLTAHAVPVLLPSALSFLLVPFYPEYSPPPGPIILITLFPIPGTPL